MPTTSKGFPYPSSTAANNVPADIQALADYLELWPGIPSLTSAQITALSGGAKTANLVVYNSTIQRLQKWNGAAWVLLVEEQAWTDWTPTIGGWVLGDGTVDVAKYTQVGKVVHFEVKITAGSSTTFGSAGDPLTVTLPVTAAGSANTRVGNGILIDASAAATYNVSVGLASTTVMKPAYDQGAALNNMYTGAPISYAAGDVVSLTGSYRVA